MKDPTRRQQRDTIIAAHKIVRTEELNTEKLTIIQDRVNNMKEQSYEISRNCSNSNAHKCKEWVQILSLSASHSMLPKEHMWLTFVLGYSLQKPPGHSYLQM
jgi:hypothetical protein